MRFGPTRALERLAARGAGGEHRPPLDRRARALSRRAVGQLGEEIAARALVRAGFELVGRNVRAPEAELDIVAWDDDEAVVVEVKTGRWPGPCGPQDRSTAERLPTRSRRPIERVTARGLERRRRAAARIASRRPGSSGSRVDVIEVLTSAEGRVGLVHHVGL